MSSVQGKILGYIGRVMVIFSIVGIVSLWPFGRTYPFDQGLPYWIISVGIGIIGYILILDQEKQKKRPKDSEVGIPDN